MKIHTTMPLGLKQHFQKELDAYDEQLEKGYWPEAWRHLERAHILGQAYPREHTHAHWKMLQFGLRIKSRKEVIGQIPRLLVGGIKSFVGTIPVGNTGGANVPPLQPMEIPEDLKIILTSTTMLLMVKFTGFFNWLACMKPEEDTVDGHPGTYDLIGGFNALRGMAIIMYVPRGSV